MKLRSIIICVALCLGFSVCGQDQFDVQDILYRIEKCITLLEQFSKKNKKLHVAVMVKSSPCPDSNCEHELVKLCIKKMACEGEIFDPILETWRLFKESFKLVEQDLFAREFAAMLCAVYQQTLNVLNLRAPQNQISPEGSIRQQITLADIILLYNKIAALPIVEVIESLEQLYKALRVLMVHYGITAETNWSTWITENWWIPPVVIASLAYTIFNRGIITKKAAAELGQVLNDQSNGQVDHAPTVT